jgi:hypothetical protein
MNHGHNTLSSTINCSGRLRGGREVFGSSRIPSHRHQSHVGVRRPGGVGPARSRAPALGPRAHPGRTHRAAAGGQRSLGDDHPRTTRGDRCPHGPVAPERCHARPRHRDPGDVSWTTLDSRPPPEWDSPNPGTVMMAFSRPLRGRQVDAAGPRATGATTGRRRSSSWPGCWQRGNRAGS